MKKIKLIIVFALASCFSGCSDSDRIVDQVFDTTTSGGILRTVSENNSTFDFNNPSVEWSITVEAQDKENGALLSSVQVYAAQYRGSALQGSEEFVKEIPASQFMTGKNGLPVGDINVSLSEVVNKLSLEDGDYLSTDEFRIRLEYVMTNGLTWTNTDAGGTVLTSSFFKSPFSYSVQFFCAIADASQFAGDFTVLTDTWADYSAGDTIPLAYNPEADGDYTFRILSTNNPYLVNAETAYMMVTVNPDDGSVTVLSNEDFDYGDGFVVPVTGSGTVGTCTGSIDLKVDFGGYTGYSFSLAKK
ncbi:MAG: hypothetical protein V7767_02060 [Leeuwenhoekiella sp.]